MAVLLALTALCCQGLASHFYDQIPANGGVTLYLPETDSSYQALYKAEQRTALPLAFAAWNQQEGAEVGSPELGRTRTLSVMTIDGDSTIALPGLPMLLPGTAGCLLDTDSCYALFGDFAPIGGLVEVEGQDYTVVGVFDYPAGMLVRQGNGQTDTGWDRVTLALEGNTDPNSGAREFAMRHGLSPYAVVPGDRWHRGAGFFARLLPLVVVVSLVLWGLMQAFRQRRTPVLAGLLMVGTMGAGALVWAVCGLELSIPTGLIPARWSDFEFWGTAVADLRTQLWLLLTLPKALPQALPMADAIAACFWGAVGSLLLLPGLRELGRTARTGLDRWNRPETE